MPRIRYTIQRDSLKYEVERKGRRGLIFILNKNLASAFVDAMGIKTPECSESSWANTIAHSVQLSGRVETAKNRFGAVVVAVDNWSATQAYARRIARSYMGDSQFYKLNPIKDKK